MDVAASLPRCVRRAALGSVPLCNQQGMCKIARFGTQIPLCVHIGFKAAR